MYANDWWIYAFGAVVMACCAVLLLVLSAATAHLLLEMLYRSRIRQRARHDYQAARGTQHLHLLRASLSVLQKSMQDRREKIKNIEQQLKSLRYTRSDELRAALSRYLVENHLTDVQGIGPQLSRRIIASCFRNDLRDLHLAHGVQGIGPTLHEAIMAWVRTMEAKLPQRLKEDFPDKQRILDAYAEKERSLQKAVAREREALIEERSLHDKAHAAALQLKKVKPGHFYRALLRVSSKTRVPAWYFLGVFPPWEPMPEWFRALLGEYGGQ